MPRKLINLWLHRSSTSKSLQVTPKSCVTKHRRPDYFKESEEKVAKFKNTLSQFCKTLEERKLGKKLGIEIKDPDDYKMQDVLNVAQELQSKHQDDKTSKGYLGKIRRCFRRLLEHRGILHNILSFIPNDSYGSAISGGFAIILAVLPIPLFEVCDGG